jgi:hypothetical protein
MENTFLETKHEAFTYKVPFLSLGFNKVIAALLNGPLQLFETTRAPVYHSIMSGFTFYIEDLKGI